MELEKEIKQSKFQNEYQKLVLNIMFTNNWIQTKNLVLMKKFQLTTQQYNVLRILRGQHPTPVMLGIIQERMLDRMSNASRLVDKLVQKQLVERRQCADNRRQVDIWITEKGLTLLGKIDPALTQQQEAFKSITVEEAHELNRILDKLRG